MAARPNNAAGSGIAGACAWQITPTVMGKYLGGPDKAGAQRAMQAMLGMVKLDIEGLKRAYEGKAA